MMLKSNFNQHDLTLVENAKKNTEKISARKNMPKLTTVFDYNIPTNFNKMNGSISYSNSTSLSYNK